MIWLVLLYQEQAHYVEAEPLYKRSLGVMCLLYVEVCQIVQVLSDKAVLGPE
jgi:hypothetical protein